MILAMLAVVAVAVLWPRLQQETSGSGPSPAGSTSRGPESGSGPSPARSTSRGPESDSPSASASPTGAPTKAELAQAVTDYYGLLPDDTDAAWELLTDSYQRQTGGRDSYEDFWGDMDSVTVSKVSATTPDRAEATITYVEKSGNGESTERRSFQLIRSDGVLKINQSTVI